MWKQIFVLVCLCYLVESSYDLLLAQTINRHGDRTPGHPIAADPAVWECTENTVALSSQVSIFYFMLY